VHVRSPLRNHGSGATRGPFVDRSAAKAFASALSEDGQMHRVSRTAWILAWLGIVACGATSATERSSEALRDEKGANAPRAPRTPRDFSEPPPNSPAPPASCGDQNGGGDQHVDFEAMREAKVAEKPEVMERQLALLEQR